MLEYYFHIFLFIVRAINSVSRYMKKMLVIFQNPFKVPRAKSHIFFQYWRRRKVQIFWEDHRSLKKISHFVLTLVSNFKIKWEIKKKIGLPTISELYVAGKRKLLQQRLSFIFQVIHCFRGNKHPARGALQSGRDTIS